MHENSGGCKLPVFLQQCNLVHAAVLCNTRTSSQDFFTVVVVPIETTLGHITSGAEMLCSPGTFLGVTEHLICLLDAVEESGAILHVIRILVRMMPEGQPAVSFLEIQVSHISRHTQDVVVAPGPTHKTG